MDFFFSLTDGQLQLADQSILSSVLHISECSNRTSDRLMCCLRDVFWKALGPAAATLEDLPDPLPSFQAEMDRSSEAPAESALERHRPKRARLPRDIPRTSKPSSKTPGETKATLVDFVNETRIIAAEMNMPCCQG